MKVDNIKKEYSKKITNKIATYKDIILESFIEFYGDDYRSIITDRFDNISFLYYINDITIFYIVNSLKQDYDDKFKNIMFSLPYIVYLIENNFYKQEVTLDNFYKLGTNKIVGSSDERLLLDEKLLMHSIAIVLRDKNENPYEVNLPFDNELKRIVALPIFSVDDKSLFHELNHAISSDIVIKNGKSVVKCGLEYDYEKKYYNEVLNDMISSEIYNIFKKKCKDNILEDNIMKDVLIDRYTDCYHLISNFYEQNKEKIKLSYIDSNMSLLEKQDLDVLFNKRKEK